MSLPPQLEMAARLFRAQRDPEHTGPGCKGLKVYEYSRKGWEENCSLCLLNGALDYETEEERVLLDHWLRIWAEGFRK